MTLIPPVSQEPFASISAADIRHLRKLLLSSMRAALATATEFDAGGRIALAAKFGGRAGGIEQAIELLDLVAAGAWGRRNAELMEQMKEVGFTFSPDHALQK